MIHFQVGIMQLLSLARSCTRHLRQIIGGLFVVFLLWPLPGFAFTWLNDWELVSSDNAGFYSAGNSLTIFTPDLLNDSKITVRRTVFTVSSEQIRVNANEITSITLNGAATLDVKVEIGEAVPINKFGPGNQFTSSSSMVNQQGDTSGLTGGSYLVTVTFELKENTTGSYMIASPSTPTSIFHFTSLP